MAQTSAGLLMYRCKNNTLEVFLVHPGGPFWQNKDLGAWSIPKGLYTVNEAPLEAAIREFCEELGFRPEVTDPLELGEIRQKSGKRVVAWAFEGDCDPACITSNAFEMQWPPKSGMMRRFPEVDRAEWFDCQTAREKINPGQIPFIDAMERHLTAIKE